MRKALWLSAVLLIFAGGLHGAAQVLAPPESSSSCLLVGSAEVVPGEDEAAVLEGLNVDVLRRWKEEGAFQIEEFQGTTDANGSFSIPNVPADGEYLVKSVEKEDVVEKTVINKVSLERRRGVGSRAPSTRYGRMIVILPLQVQIDGETVKGVYRAMSFEEGCNRFTSDHPGSPWRPVVEEALREMESALFLQEKEKKIKESERESLRLRKDAEMAQAKPKKEPPPRRYRPGIILLIFLGFLALLFFFGVRRFRRGAADWELPSPGTAGAEAEGTAPPDRSEEKKGETPPPGEGRDKAPAAEAEEGIDEDYILFLMNDKTDWFADAFYKGKAFMHHEEYERAEKYFRRTVSFMEENCSVLERNKEVYRLVLHYAYLGRCLLYQGKLREAVEAFRRGQGLDAFNAKVCEDSIMYDALQYIVEQKGIPPQSATEEHLPFLTEEELGRLKKLLADRAASAETGKDPA